MTEQPAHGMTMASRGQAAHHPDRHASPADELVRMAEEDGLYDATPGRGAPHLSMTERIRVAQFDAAPSAPESWRPDDIRTGPGGCHAALIVRGEHFWCDSKAPHTGWPHGNTAEEATWRGSDSTGDSADTEDPAELRERVARALCDGDAGDHGTYTWDEAGELEHGELQDDYRRAARHAIAAMEETR